MGAEQTLLVNVGVLAWRAGVAACQVKSRRRRSVFDGARPNRRSLREPLAGGIGVHVSPSVTALFLRLAFLKIFLAFNKITSTHADILILITAE